MLTPDELAELRSRLMNPELPAEDMQCAERWRVGELLATVELLQAELEQARGLDHAEQPQQ
jgi:hypothetical protein